MKLAKKWLLVSLLIPIVALLLMVAKSQYDLSVGKQVVFAISGYDPRNLLSGHYLIYQIDYQTKDYCQQYPQARKAFYWLSDKRFHSVTPSDARSLYIKGHCEGRRFVAGIEKFYISEQYAKEFDKLVRNKQARLVVSVTASGEAKAVDLLIDDIPWRTYIDKKQQ